MVNIARRAPAAADCRLDLFSSSGGTIRLSPVVQVETQALPAALDDYSAIIVSGFFADDLTALARQLKTAWQPAISLLRDLPAPALIAASCYGTFVLGESGRLDRQRATTTWWLGEVFQKRYPAVELDADQSLVDAGDVITAGAMTAHTDLSLHVLRRLYGAPLARQVASIMLVDGARTSQRPFMALPQRFSDPLVNAAATWMARQSAGQVSARDLAAAVHVSYRTLHRHFDKAAGMPPLAYLQALRVEEAKELLEGTRLSLDQILEKIGYTDVSAFRRLFLRSTGLSPSQYRLRFQQPGRSP